ncbi:amidohydrolase 2 [Annulohypoxylon maeteangense]|uniref:amidohydrolase 2 n=1 Tax=Annulohypoxylon maeteangense TaxID=1927788 RepID=UPI002007C2CB|nr:amidohydrolase 2 [Annulohypoxylon maeteangense]KAI0884542.1 amidohydrolase 2 [Annulohypoxylon maeteangense]
MYPPSFSVTLEEHASFPSLGMDRPFFNGMSKIYPTSKKEAEDHSAGRIAAMDEGHVSYQIMSHIPGTGNDRPEACQKANDEMAEAIKKSPNRFGGFAALPMGYPEKAAVELERVVKRLGFQGAMIDSHLDDMTHFDDERFWPVFEMAERLDVPIYIHPGPPTETFIQKRYGGNYPVNIMMGLSTAVWGWHEDVGLHILKLYSAGLFDRFTKLKIIIGHMGEMIPMMLDRAGSVLSRYRENEGGRSFFDVWDQNIWVTSSGIFSVRALEMLLKVTKTDRVMYSIDTPFSKSVEGWNYLQELADKTTLSKEDLDNFAFGNAKRLFKLDTELKKF